MKAVDITLFFQAIHFFIAYLILKKYVFNPVFAILLNEESLEKEIVEGIKSVNAQTEMIAKQKKERWEYITKSLLSMIPKASIPFFTHDQKIEIDKKDLSLKMTDKQKQEVKSVIVQFIMQEKL